MRNGLRVNVFGALFLAALMTGASMDSPVADAAERGDLEAVRSLVRQGADANAAQGDGMTALHWAALRGDGDMTTVLLYAGANPEATTRLGGYTPVLLASKEGQTTALVLLLEAGADLQATTSTGASALHLAAASGRGDAVSALVQHGNEVDSRELAYEQTPLMWATARNRLEAVAALLEAGADVSLRTRVVDFAEVAAQDGPDQQRRDRVVAAARQAQQEAEQAEQQGEQAQQEAEAEQQGEQAQQEREQGQQQAQQGQQGQQQPQQQGQQQPQQSQQVSRQAQQAARSFTDLVGLEGGLTALHYAARDGRLEVAQLLVEVGADVDQTTADGTTPLLMAAINGNYDLAMYLLERGAGPNLVSEDGAAPLYATLSNRWAPKAFYPQPTAFKQQETSYLDLMRTLLEAGADVDHRTDRHIWYASFSGGQLGVTFDGATAFWRAAYATDVPAMRLLVAYGANPDIPTKKGTSGRFARPSQDDEPDESGLPPVPIGGDAVLPIHAASGVGYGVARAGNSHRHVPDGWLPAVKYLVEELGADVDARDHDGYSPVHHAAARGDNELIRYLVSRGADVTYVSRRGQTTADLANGPQQRVQPFFGTIVLLEKLGSKNNHDCLSC